MRLRIQPGTEQLLSVLRALRLEPRSGFYRRRHQDPDLMTSPLGPVSLTDDLIINPCMVLPRISAT